MGGEMTEPERDLLAEFTRCREELERALKFTGGTHDLDSVWKGIQDGDLQLWVAEHSVMVTEVQSYPLCRVLHFFLAAGRMEELEALYPLVMEWGRDEMDCTRASLAGRPGWARSFLTKKQGWEVSHLIIMKEI